MLSNWLQMPCPLIPSLLLVPNGVNPHAQPGERVDERAT